MFGIAGGKSISWFALFPYSFNDVDDIYQIEKDFFYVHIRCGRVMADNIAYAKFRKSLLIW